ncbi:TetR/AcrR family transcriptional regulator [Pokkaliibacter sp. MBI-7]|uniref:TetR/AcrR family transcriptional regulator n=1 Tax=Pokkaliibacter sp. MBI-7 TaxID=3040600 RepID=UPI002448EE07|nr:TetR/AcrR family transcriptional regulator [Pokkaliibacter sp. MBI-7]MDH2432636.1 TetR/AcrR family transcriptional regulator [Pokkaliibacter sp. MBI-7]
MATRKKTTTTTATTTPAATATPAKPRTRSTKPAASRTPAAASTAEAQQERRQAILSTALDLLQSQGYTATSMLAIARDAGASKETLYSWFGNREGLFVQLIEQHIAQHLTPLLSASVSDAAVLPVHLRAVLAFWLSPATLALTRAAISETNPALAQALNTQGLQATTSHLAIVLASLGLSCPVNSDQGAYLLSSLLGPYQLSALLSGETVSLDDSLSAHIEDVLASCAVTATETVSEAEESAPAKAEKKKKDKGGKDKKDKKKKKKHDLGMLSD